MARVGEDLIAGQSGAATDQVAMRVVDEDSGPLVAGLELANSVALNSVAGTAREDDSTFAGVASAVQFNTVALAETVDAYR